MKHRNLWLVVLLLLGVSSPAFAQQFDLGTALQQYQTASAQFASTIATAAKWLAVTLATIDFSLLILQKLVRCQRRPKTDPLTGGCAELNLTPWS